MTLFKHPECEVGDIIEESGASGKTKLYYENRHYMVIGVKYNDDPKQNIFAKLYRAVCLQDGSTHVMTFQNSIVFNYQKVA